MPLPAQMLLYQQGCLTFWWFCSAATWSRHSVSWQWLPFVNVHLLFPHHLLTQTLGTITLILLLVMLTCVFFGFRQKSEVLVVPVATLFAFTQLRGSMPGAPPGFGKRYVILYFLDYPTWNLISKGDVLGGSRLAPDIRPGWLTLSNRLCRTFTLSRPTLTLGTSKFDQLNGTLTAPIGRDHACCLYHVGSYWKVQGFESGFIL